MNIYSVPRNLRTLLRVSAHNRIVFPILLLLLTASSSACGGADTESDQKADQVVAELVTSTAVPAATQLPTATATARAVPTASSTVSPTPSATPTSTPVPTETATVTPTPTSTPVLLDAAALYEQFSPSIFQLFSPFSSGSGFLIEGNYILTAAHVVYPHEYILVALPGGQEDYVPVHSVDLMVDLAILGPIDDHDREPLELAFNKSLQPGDQVAVIGFDHTEETHFVNIKPETKEGTILERLSWSGLDVDFYQTDIDPTSGNSGSPLFNAQGQVVGIVNFAHGEPPTLIVPAMADLETRINAALEGEGAEILAERRLDYETSAETEFRFMISDSASGLLVMLPEPANEPWELTLERAKADMTIFDCFGDFVAATWEEDSNTLLVEETEYAPYFVRTYGESFGLSDVLSSNLPLIPFDDPDDEHEVKIGDVVHGALDYPRDYDNFNLELDAGQEILLSLESFMIDPVLIIGSEGESLEFAQDDDSGGGLRGLDATLTYKAPESGYYTITVGSQMFGLYGGYLLHIDEPDALAPTPMAIDGETYQLFLETDVGDMDHFTTPDGQFKVLFPYSMSKAVVNVPEIELYCTGGKFTCYMDQRAVIAIVQESLYQPARSVPTLEEWANEMIIAYEANPAVQVEETSWLETDAGSLPYFELTVQQVNNIPLRVYQLLIIQENNGTAITYLVPQVEEEYLDLQPQIMYTFEHLEVLSEE